MKKQQYLVVLTLLCSVVAVAQFALDGQFKPRTEYRHGFGSIIPQSADAGFAVSTRIRLNTSYTIDIVTEIGGTPVAVTYTFLVVGTEDLVDAPTVSLADLDATTESQGSFKQGTGAILLLRITNFDGLL